MIIQYYCRKLCTYPSSTFAARARASCIGEVDGRHNEHGTHGTVFAVDVGKLMQRVNCLVLISNDQVTADHQQVSLRHTQQCFKQRQVSRVARFSTSVLPARSCSHCSCSSVQLLCCCEQGLMLASCRLSLVCGWCRVQIISRSTCPDQLQPANGTTPFTATDITH